MEFILIGIGIILLLLGYLGILLPIIPSTPLGFAALLLLHFSKIHVFSSSSLIFYTVLSIVLLLSDYFLPAVGAKKYGATKYGMIGATIGGFLPLLIFPISGLFAIPLIIVGTYIGAFVAEYMHQSKDLAHKAAIGSLIGFVWTFLFKFIGMILFTASFIMALFCHYKNGSFCSKMLLL
jgi:uncharacterized protein YqgC (DUF456 family)